MNDLTLYARYEPPTFPDPDNPHNRPDVVLYRDLKCQRRYAFYTCYRRHRPTRRHHSWMLNCYKWQLVWLPDLVPGILPSLIDIVQHNTHIIDSCLSRMPLPYSEHDDPEDRLLAAPDTSSAAAIRRLTRLVRPAVRSMPCDDLTFSQIWDEIATWQHRPIGRQLLGILIHLGDWGVSEYKMTHPWRGRRPFATRFHIRRISYPYPIPNHVVYAEHYNQYTFYICLTRT
jgi:hypothetical protein